MDVVSFFFPMLHDVFNTAVLQVRRMSSNLTDQVPSIVTVITAVAKGDLTHKIEIYVEARLQP